MLLKNIFDKFVKTIKFFSKKRKISQIENVLKAIHKRNVRLDKLYKIWLEKRLPCCPSCAFPEYSKLTEKNNRARAWAAILLTKRNFIGDKEKAEALIRDGANFSPYKKKQRK